MNHATLLSAICAQWDKDIVPQLTDYVRIPAKSPHFDPHWQAHGHIERVIRLAQAWVRKQPVCGLGVEIVRLPGRTPLLHFDVPGTGERTVLLYGHLDKQPEMKGWSEGLGPWIPVRKDDRLYGRGSADDGYAIYASLGALKALREQNVPRARCVVMIEACEESGSYDLPFYVDHLLDRIGQPSLVVCLDSGCGDYDRLW
ncbi:MAG: M20/M25/M40 family metallo-hydrolase, partial [Casimicrobiaceae bacterium]